MYIHVFAFRWKSGTTEAQKNKAATEIRAFQGNIPGLIETYVGTNISSRGQDYAFGGVMKFSDQAAFEAYSIDPSHQALLAWLLPLVDALEIDLIA